MSAAERLHPVAALLGIETRHSDALGVTHEPDAETLKRLIAAFGLPSDPQSARSALAEMQRGRPFGLDPLVVVGVEAPRLRLEAAGDAVIEWHCQFEDGAHAEGQSGAGEAELQLPGPMPPGYHRLDIKAGATTASIGLAAAPVSCYLPDALRDGSHVWGVTAQVYGLRSARNWGMGDLGDLKMLCRAAGVAGATTVGINPLHALFASEPRHTSPYSPSSRTMLDYLYIDPTAVPGFTPDMASENALAPLRATDLVDHAAVAALKRPVLEALYRRLGNSENADFREFRKHGGRALAAFATFEALHEKLNGERGLFSWHDWPPELRDPNSTAVAKFAKQHRDRVGFFEFLQWQADAQLGAAAAAGSQAGLALGLYRDLAVGVNPQGAEAWAEQGLVVPGMGIGAPPDALSRAGQDWGLAPLSPLELRQAGFQPFIAALRASMRHAGVLRIDHVMSLQRLYWVPRGQSAVAGAYVTYPFAELLRLVALESHRQHCAVVGEDLGTVPPGFRETMQQANLLSYRVVMFERHWAGGFTAPRDYPALAAASAATHDLPTLKGFWLGRDIAWRQKLGLYPSPDAEMAEINDRKRDRWQLLEALAGEGLIARERFGEFLPDADQPVYSAALGEAILAFLARSRARLMLVQFEDVAGEEEQANLPGTSDAHPNWRRRLTAQLEDLLAGPELQRIAALVGEERRRAA
jgi:4-alpha-glucanotransferase